jgi:hypothetical protein
MGLTALQVWKLSPEMTNRPNDEEARISETSAKFYQKTAIFVLAAMRNSQPADRILPTYSQSLVSSCIMHAVSFHHPGNFRPGKPTPSHETRALIFSLFYYCFVLLCLLIIKYPYWVPCPLCLLFPYAHLFHKISTSRIALLPCYRFRECNHSEGRHCSVILVSAEACLLKSRADVGGGGVK